LQIYKSKFVVVNAGIPEAGKPIIHVFFAVSVNELEFNTQD
jgi:hypothetical protein